MFMYMTVVPCVSQLCCTVHIRNVHIVQKEFPTGQCGVQYAQVTFCERISYASISGTYSYD